MTTQPMQQVSARLRKDQVRNLKARAALIEEKTHIKCDWTGLIRTAVDVMFEEDNKPKKGKDRF